MRLTLLGSGGFMPTDRRETACALVRSGDAAVLIDAGTGARRLLTEPGLLEGVERLHVVLTHFHLDHTIGLFYVTDVEPRVEVWGAGQALEETPTSHLLGRLLGSPFAPRTFLSRIAAVHDMAIGHTQIGPFGLETRVQPRHINPTLALRFGDELVWCTDTAYDDGNREFARGAGVLCHEAFYPSDTTSDPGHTAAGDAARLAAAAGVDRLILIHVNPELDDDDGLLNIARAQFAATQVGRDGAVVLR
ncbi:MAG: MBL fold metallo-hydrolase [Gaiellaceae bacterium]